MEVRIPNSWDPREYQVPFFEAGKKRAVLVYHRRAGKDSMSLNYTAIQAFDRVGNYWHMLPKITQARKAIWNGIDRDGRRIIDQVFPKEVRKRTNGQEMIIELANGSTWQLCGSDNYDSLVGSNPVGVVFSEWSLCDPNAWNYIRPMLAENGGWALFIYTPRGKNHGYTLYQMAKKNPDWFCEMLTVNDTKRPDGTPVIGPEIIAEERAEGMDEALVQQEYFCSFDAQIPGAYYADELQRARDDGRIGQIPIDPMLPISTAWDLGISDSMSLWFYQVAGKEIRLVHYYEANNKGLEHYVQYIRKFCTQHGCSEGEHLAPHDIEVRELSTGHTRKTAAAKMGLTFRTVQGPRAKSEGIQAVRRILPRCWIDENRAEHGLACLSSYHREYDDKLQAFKDNPVHDWASHGADAMQTLALGYREVVAKSNRPTAIQANTNFSIFG
jgi:hypothetical protein